MLTASRLVAMTAIVSLGVGALVLSTGGGPSPVTSSTFTSPGSAAARASSVEGLLDGLLETRIAGAGAQRFLIGPEKEVTLLYATSSGAPYERGEFEQINGVEWPYGESAFMVRLFAGDTLVEQLFFGKEGRSGLEYVEHGFATEIPPTTEDGQPVAWPHHFFGGRVTAQAPHPWIFHPSGTARLIPEGPDVRPTTDGGERNEWDGLWLMAESAPVGLGCGPVADANAAAMAEGLRTRPGLKATAPVALNIAGAEALMVDLGSADFTTFCATSSAGPRVVFNTGEALGRRMRLYLFDAPEGSAMRVLAVAITASQSTFERAVKAAWPIVASVEFHATRPVATE